MFAWFSDVVAEILKNSEHLHVSKRDVMIMQEEYIDTLVWSFIYLKMHRKIKKKKISGIYHAGYSVFRGEGGGGGGGLPPPANIYYLSPSYTNVSYNLVFVFTLSESRYSIYTATLLINILRSFWEFEINEFLILLAYIYMC